MGINRRRFMALMGVLGASAGVSPTIGSESSQSSASTYEEVRSRLAGAKLFFVPYGHNDYGWLNSNLWDRERTPLVHREALEIMRRERDFKWYFDTEFEAMSWLLDRYPEMEDELRQRVKEGQFGIAPGSFCNPDNPFMEPEAMIRNIVLGRRDFEAKFPGVNLEVAVFNDIHPGYSQIPQLLRKAGYRFYRVTRPMQALDKKGYKREFIWEGLDGSEILFSHGPYGWEGGGAKAVEEINNYPSDWEKAVVALYEAAMKGLLPNSATKLIWLPLGYDYGRPLRAFFTMQADEPYLDVPGFLREWKKRESVPFVFATPTEYFTELDKMRSALPRIKGVLDPVGWPFWYGGGGSHGLYIWRERNARDLVEAEIFCSMGSLLGASYPAKQIESLWYDKLRLDPHDGLYVGDDDVMELVELARYVRYEGKKLRTQSMVRLTERIAADPEKQAIALFNPLNWSRREVLEIHPVFPKPGTTRVRVLDSKGNKVPHQLLKLRHMGGETQKLYYKEADMLVDVEIPPLGYTTLTIEPLEGSEEAAYPESPVTVLESRYARLQLSDRGIESLEDKVRGAHYPGAGNPVYRMTEDTWTYHGGPFTSEARVSGAAWKLVEEGPLRSSAKMEGKVGPHKATIEVQLYHSIERIDFRLELDSVGGNGHFVVRIPFEYGGRLSAGIPFGAEIRDLSREPFGKEAGEERLRENVFYAHHWVDYSDGQKGLTLLAAEGQRGFRFDPQKGFLEHILLMTIRPMSLDEASRHRGSMAEWESLFVNRFFRGTGRHTFRYSMIPHHGDWRQAQSLRRAQEQLYPVRWTHIHPRPGADLPLQKSFLTVSPETVALSSWLHKADGYFLRLYETAGQAGPVQVELPFEAGVCEIVDLNGRRWDSPPIDLRGHRARFSIHPWEIVTLRFTRAGESR